MRPEAVAVAAVALFLTSSAVAGQQASLTRIPGAWASAAGPEAFARGGLMAAQREVCLNAGVYVFGVRVVDVEPPEPQLLRSSLTWGALFNPETGEELDAGALVRKSEGQTWGWSAFQLQEREAAGRMAQGCFVLYVFNGEARIWRLGVDLRDWAWR